MQHAHEATGAAAGVGWLPQMFLPQDVLQRGLRASRAAWRVDSAPGQEASSVKKTGGEPHQRADGETGSACAFASACWCV